MAAIDYGALLRVDGEFINKNGDLFMDKSDTGYSLKEAFYKDRRIYGEAIAIDGNFYVYAGDADLLLTFYKGYFYIISNGEILKSVSNNPFLSESFLVGGTNIKVSHLDKTPFIDRSESQTWAEYVRDNWNGATGDEKLSDLEGGLQAYRRFLRRIKKRKRGAFDFKYYTNRWRAEWEHKGKRYEVVFGYGIDPDESVWNDIKADESYGFSQTEIEIIDEWFRNSNDLVFA